MPASFADRLLSLRKDSGLSLRELSLASGIPTATLHRWERSQFSPGLDGVEKLAKAFDMTVLELLWPLYETGEPPFPLAI